MDIYKAIDRVAKAKPAQVANRECLWRGGSISIMVPASARPGRFPAPGSRGLSPWCAQYAQFTQNVKGGVVNLFVHDENPTLFLGKKIVADAEVWQKELKDGRKYLYVDLRPVAAGTKPTHRLVVMSVKKEELQLQDDFITFQTPEPLVGTIVVAPVGSKVLIKASLAGIEQLARQWSTMPLRRAATH